MTVESGFARLIVLCVYALVAAGCGSDSGIGEDRAGEIAQEERDEEPVNTGGEVNIGYTYQGADGNRLVGGRGALPAAMRIDLALDGVPVWLVAAPAGEGSVWAAVLEDGRVQGFRVVGDRAAPASIVPDRLPEGTPPLLVVEGVRPRLLPLPEDASPSTHPIALEDGRTIYVALNGDLVMRGVEGEESRAPIDALPDARLLLDGEERILLLTDPTGRYGHGVLGDAVEGAGLALVETRSGLDVTVEIHLPEPLVVEGIAPIWVDLDGDGRREIVVTVSDEDAGARLAVYDEEGNRVATGPAIGQGYRWRHQLAIAPFADDRVAEIAAVRTPHIGGIVEFYRLRGTELELVTQLDGYSSHVIGARNLDMGMAGDFDGDGVVELLVPEQDRMRLGAIARTASGARAVWQVEVGGELTTNLAAAELADGRMVIGAGHGGGALRLWLP